MDGIQISAYKRGGYLVERIYCGQVIDNYVTHDLTMPRKTKWMQHQFSKLGQNVTILPAMPIPQPGLNVFERATKYLDEIIRLDCLLIRRTAERDMILAREESRKMLEKACNEQN
jgi:hypothetical protein